MYCGIKLIFIHNEKLPIVKVRQRWSARVHVNKHKIVSAAITCNTNKYRRRRAYKCKKKREREETTKTRRRRKENSDSGFIWITRCCDAPHQLFHRILFRYARDFLICLHIKWVRKEAWYAFSKKRKKKKIATH